MGDIFNSCDLNAALLRFAKFRQMLLCSVQQVLPIRWASAASSLTHGTFLMQSDQFSQSTFYGASTMPMTALKQAHGSGPFYRYPPGFDATRHAQVLAFNESQFDFSKHYYSRDVLYSFRVFSEVQ